MNPTPPSPFASLPTREKILTAAAELFAGKGFYAVSVREISRAVGIKESSLYNHFKNKEHLLEEILHNFQSEWDIFLDQFLYEETSSLIKTRQAGEDFLLREFNRFLKFWNKPQRKNMWLIISIEQHRNPRAARIVLQGFKKTRKVLEEFFKNLPIFNNSENDNFKFLASEFIYAARTLLTDYSLFKTIHQSTASLKKEMTDTINCILDKT